MAHQWHAQDPNGLTQEFQALVQELQTTYTERIVAAQMKGDFAALQTLALELQNVLQELQASFYERLEALQANSVPMKAAAGDAVPTPPAASERRTTDQAAPRPALHVVKDTPGFVARNIKDYFKSSSCTVNLEQIAYDGDFDVINGLLADASFMQAIDGLLDHRQTFNSRRELLKSSLRLSPKMAPRLAEVGERCRQTLGLKPKLDFYVYQNSQYNASIYPSSENELYIMLTSSLLEQFSEDELAFVVGHEIGHYLFDHFHLPVHFILEHGSEVISPLQAMKLFAWKRNAEISADRMGLLCSRNFEAAVRSFFKLSSGIGGDSLSFNLQEYLDQFKDLKEELAKEENSPEEWYSTHPFSPLRVKALELFSLSDTYKNVTAEGIAKITEAEMEKQISDLMALMEPDYLNDNSEVGKVLQEFMFLGGFAIAAANGAVEHTELLALGSLVQPEVAQAGLTKVHGKSVAQILVAIGELSRSVRINVARAGRYNLIKDLAIVVYADGSIDESEVYVLYHLCQELNVAPEFADHILHAARQGFD